MGDWALGIITWVIIILYHQLENRGCVKHRAIAKFKKALV